MGELPFTLEYCPVGPADRWVLREIENLLRDLSLIDTVGLHPTPHEPSRVRATLDTDEWTISPQTVEMVIHWSTDGGFSITYREDRAEEELWWCRWDHHASTDSPLVHFHAPPDGERTEEVSFPSYGEGTANLSSAHYHPVDVVLTALSAISDNRIGE